MRTAWQTILLEMTCGIALALPATANEPIASEAASPPDKAAQATLFFDHIRPLLVAKCQQCHGEEAQEGKLRLDSRDALLAGGESGPSLVPGKSDESLLVKAVRYASPDLQMPPKEKLPDADIAALEQWISAGAFWPAPVLALFEDEVSVVSTLSDGGGSIRLDETDKFRGAASVVIQPQRHAVKIADWNFPIRENPAIGEYRFIRFAWKKRGAGAILFEVARNGTWREQPQTNGAWVAGKNTSGWGAVDLAAEPPQEWTVVTRDLWADGHWGDFDLTGISLTALDGGEALIDSILLGRDVESLDAYELGRGKLALAPPEAKEPIGDAWSDPRNPIRKLFKGERLDLWSLKKPVRPDLPEVQNNAWARTPIDRFILSAQETLKIGPSPEADRQTLIRRLYFDLIGLPPTPDEVAAFVADKADDAYEQLVERLLASSHYGERQARLWLDVVRYSDTNNFERDEFRPQMWRYRDWVIRTLNADKPYDRFLREQLAGDELVGGLPANSEEADALTATGFLRLGPWDSTAAIFEEDKRGRDQLMADLVNTTGSAVLGMTMACCNCHDHKYDPLSQADHFRFRAFFAGVKFRDDLVVDTAEARSDIDQHNAAIDEVNKPQQAILAKHLETARVRVTKQRRAELSSEVQKLLAKAEKNRTAAEQEQLKPVLEKLTVSDADAQAAFTEAEKAASESAQKQIDEYNAGRRAYQTCTGMSDSGREAPVTHVFFQGDFSQPKEEVAPGFLSVLDPNPAVIQPRENLESTGRRTALVDWLVSEENPLTARVMVNRLWQQHFGTGLVASPNDFGYSGARPTHPELLDWLAIEFRSHGWSIKEMHRLMVLSASYRQTSTHRDDAAKLDPENQLLSRQNVQRLSAEGLRDAMLAVSGKLLPVDRGEPRWPPVPLELLTAQPAILEDMEGKGGGRGQGYPAQPLEETFVRSVFLVQKACVPLPLLQAFDLPEVSVSCGRRNITTVAPQALTLLNSPFSIAMAHALAERAAKEAGSEPARQIERAVSLSLARQPTADEQKLLDAMYEEHVKLHTKRLAELPDAKSDDSSLTAIANQSALADICRALMNLNEFVYVD